MHRYIDVTIYLIAFHEVIVNSKITVETFCKCFRVCKQLEKSSVYTTYSSVVVVTTFSNFKEVFFFLTAPI